MCFKYKYKNERLLNIIKWRKHFLLRNCLKPNRENKNHKSNLHPQPPKGKHLKFLQLKKKKKNTKSFLQKERKQSQMLGKLREKMSSMHISENLVKNTLKNRWIKTKQCGKQRRTVHKANPEVSHCQAPLTHATLTAWMWRTRPQVHIQESKNQSLQQSEVDVWA